MAACRAFSTLECCSGSEYSGNTSPEYSFPGQYFGKSTSSPFRKLRSSRFLQPLSFTFLRLQLCTKVRRNRRNNGVSRIVAASWSNSDVPPPTAAADDIFSEIPVNDEDSTAANSEGSTNTDGVQLTSPTNETSDASIAGERICRGIATDGITTPVVNTSAYRFKSTSELIDEGPPVSFEYGRYGNPTSAVAEEKISALEGAESTMLTASGMCASTVPAGGDIVTTIDCNGKTRIATETDLPKIGTKHVIPPAYRQQSYEIFISHRGPDTKKNVSGLLRLRLSREFRVFFDTKSIKPGDYWLEKIDMAIRECKIGIVVFSPGYCNSYVCLHELALLMECKKKVIPIFCDVKPSELRVRDDGSCSPKDPQRYRWAIEEAKRVSGITFDTAKGDWPQLIDDSSDAVKNLLEVEERD